MPLGVRVDPFFAHSFLVEIDQVAQAGFQQVSGLETTTAPVPYREGNDPPTMRQLAGLVTYPAIVLRWGITTSAAFWQWRERAMTGRIERRNGSIVLLDELGQEQVRWNFVGGWPSKWTGPALNATANEVAIESVEITHEGLVRA
ncbi:phage tail-like protein [Actinoplanes octamycinicus]|uniref:Phage tail-like protein n=1 Tax=Actinoplanes octamycinicus TaxID=135948 RepID=A0A7W7H5L8_9ACTN|nr:phage tail protein [Actinoplanes octamycinicus]MBB4744082.1 phage tail-like protein [Actinoplanes octamycinicus]GIE56961.1 phage tail protein [Actinoplanes octamycinicus]